jgi:hypothetical protein
VAAFANAALPRQRRFLLLLAALWLACAAQLASAAEPTLSCVGAQREAGLDTADQLRLTLRFAPSDEITQALDSSIALHFAIRIQAASGERTQRLTLSRDALLGRYTLTHAERVAHFRLRAELFDALSNTLNFATAGDIQRLRIRLLLGELPAPLRLPALFDPDWHVDTGWCVMQHEPAA